MKDHHDLVNDALVENRQIGFVVDLMSLDVSDGLDFDDSPSRTVNLLTCAKRRIAARRQHHPDVDHRATVF